MHVHGSQMNTTPVNAYAAAAETALARQRAEDVRKKLAKSAATVEAGADPDQAFLVGQWTESHDNSGLTGDEYRAGTTGKDSDFS